MADMFICFVMEIIFNIKLNTFYSFHGQQHQYTIGIT